MQASPLRCGLAAAILLAVAPGPARAADCTYTDLQGQFTVTADCDGLQDYSGIGQEQKRLWLAGPWGELQVMEVPDPYRTVELDHVMENLGRFWTTEHTPQPPSPTTVAGIDARAVTERKMRTTSRSWVFNLGGRNLIARAVAYGPRKEREAKLEQVARALVDGFKPVPAPSASPSPAASGEPAAAAP